MAFAFPMFWLLDTRDPLTITLTIVAAITFGQMVGFAVGAPWYSELFAARTALQRRFARLPSRRGDRRPHPVCGGHLYGLDGWCDVANLGLSDRARLHHLHRDDGRA